MSNIEHIEAPEIEFPPDYRNYLVYCDESGIDSQDYYGWGSLWIPAERRGDLAELLGSLKKKHRFEGEVKWKKVKPRAVDFYKELTAAFFTSNWMMFHCLVFLNRAIKKELFDGGMVEARLHHLNALLRNKIAFFSAQDADKAYHVRVDPLPSPYAKEDEKMHKITNAQLKMTLGRGSVVTLLTRDSKLSAGVQLADFLLGAVLSSWNASSAEQSPKAQMSKFVAGHLGWKDFRADTWPKEWKFNVWHYHDPKAGARRLVGTRNCKWVYSVKPYRRRGR